jgi:hypothetical protein
MFTKRIAILALAAMAMPGWNSPILAKDATVTVKWGSSSREDRSVSALQTSLWPKIRNSVCNTYRHGQYPGSVMKLGSKVVITFVGSAGEVLASFTVTSDKCG